MLNNALKACSGSGGCSSGAADPALLDLTREECLGLLRRKELRLYGDAVSVMRAQGALTEAKRDLLRSLRAALGVSEARHRCECRRAALDEELAAIADWIFGRDTAGDWREEGRSVVPALDWSPGGAVLTEAGRQADSVAADQRRKQKTATNGSGSKELQQRARDADQAKAAKQNSSGRQSRAALPASPVKPTQQLLSKAAQRQEELLAAAEEFRRQLLASSANQQQQQLVSTGSSDHKDSEGSSDAAPASAAAAATPATPVSESNDDPLAQATAAAIAGDLVTLANVAVSAMPPTSQPLAPPSQQQQQQPSTATVVASATAAQPAALTTPTRPPVLVQTTESVQTPIYIVAGPPTPATEAGRGFQQQQQQPLQPQQQQQQTVRVISRPGAAGFAKPVIVVQKPAISAASASKIVGASSFQPQLHHQLLFATAAPAARTLSTVSTAAPASAVASAVPLPVHGVDLDEEPLPPPPPPQLPVGQASSSISMSMALTLAASAASNSNVAAPVMLGSAAAPAVPTVHLAGSSGAFAVGDWRAPALDLLDRLSPWSDSRRPAAGGLAIIRARLLAGEYRALDELDADVRLMKGAGADLLAAYEAELAGLRDRLGGGRNDNNNSLLAPPSFKKRRY